MLPFPPFRFESTEVDNNQGNCCQLILIDRRTASAQVNENIDAPLHSLTQPVLLRKFSLPGTILGARDTSTSKTYTIPCPLETYLPGAGEVGRGDTGKIW